VPFPVFLATSTDPSDDPLESLAEGEGIEVHRGPLDDVLGRAAGAARHFRLDVIARLCGDRPYFDTDEMARAIGLALDDPTIDLVSNWIPGRTAPGLTTEVIQRSALERADREAFVPEEREHVTSWFYASERNVRIEHIESRANRLCGRFAVDTPGDLAALRPDASWPPAIGLDQMLAARPMLTSAPSVPDAL
jgi:spore coat polysaccharide biosynthesis protein SpsF